MDCTSRLTVCHNEGTHHSATVQALAPVDFNSVAAKGCFVYCYLRAKDSATAKAGTPFYVGFASNAKRPTQTRNHLTGVPADHRLIRVLKKGLTKEEAFAYERFYIARYGRKQDGGILANQSLGGDGNTGWRHDQKTKAIISQTFKGRPKTAEHSLKISEALKGKPKSETHRAKMSIARKGCKGAKHTAASKAKISLGNKGKKRTPEQCKAHGRRISEMAAARYGLTYEQYTSLSRQYRINMSSWLKRKSSRTPLEYVRLFGDATLVAALAP